MSKLKKILIKTRRQIFSEVAGNNHYHLLQYLSKAQISTLTLCLLQQQAHALHSRAWRGFFE